MRRGASIALLVTAGALLASGCGNDSADTDEEQITAVLNKLFEAQEAGDAETACGDVYVIQEPPRPGSEASGEAEGSEAEGEGEEGEAGIEACKAAFEQADAHRRSEISDLSTDVGTIEVDGDRATAIVHTQLTRSDGSELDQDAPYDLVRTPDGWRIRISEEG